MGTNTVDFGNLTIEIQQSANEVVYRFSCEVDEHFRQREVPRISKPNITFILEDVATFNSCGIREWIYLVREIGELGSLRFTRCSVAMIDQINMVPDSLGKGCGRVLLCALLLRLRRGGEPPHQRCRQHEPSGIQTCT